MSSTQFLNLSFIPINSLVDKNSAQSVAMEFLRAVELVDSQVQKLVFVVCSVSTAAEPQESMSLLCQRLWLTLLILRLKRSSIQTRTRNPEAFYLAEYLDRKKKRAITSNGYIQNLCNVYDDHSKKSYWISQIHILKRTHS